MYPLESRHRAAHRHPDFPGQVVRLICEGQILPSIQKLSDQVDSGQLFPAFRINNEL
jgi:hypothetical protein